VSITLPRFPRNTGYVMRPVREGRVLRAATGGSRLPISRLGDHWAMEVDPRVLGIECGRELVADVLRGSSETVRAYVPNPGVEIGSPGAPLVAGADQSGSEIDLDGLTPHFVIRKGWFVTIETTGSPRLYMVTAESVVAADGTVTLPLWPMLHVPPADNDPVEIAEPYIEGLVDEGGEHEVGLLAAAELEAFLIEEPD